MPASLPVSCPACLYGGIGLLYVVDIGACESQAHFHADLFIGAENLSYAKEGIDYEKDMEENAVCGYHGSIGGRYAGRLRRFRGYGRLRGNLGYAEQCRRRRGEGADLRLPELRRRTGGPHEPDECGLEPDALRRGRGAVQIQRQYGSRALAGRVL